MSLAPVAAPLPGFGPVAPQERIETLDILRGFALFGVLVANWVTDFPGDMEAYKGWTGRADVIAYGTIEFLLNEKARPIFTFLFGLGFALQMQRAEARGARFVATYARRLAVLFLIGAAHFILTERDILWVYAISGFFLLPLRKLNLNLLIALALICILIPFTRDALLAHDRELQLTNFSNARTEITLDSSVLDTYVGVYEYGEAGPRFVTREGNALFWQAGGGLRRRLFAESPTDFFYRSIEAEVSFVKDSTGTVIGLVGHSSGRDVPGRMIQRGGQTIDDKALRRAANQGPSDRTYATGTFGQIVRMRALLFWDTISSWTTYLGWSSDFALFLLGLYAGRRRIFQEVAIHRQFIRKVMSWTLAVGLAGTTAFITVGWNDSPFYSELEPFTTRVLVDLGSRLGSPALGLAYLAALTLLLQRVGWKRRLAPLGTVGRMALTNYLLQSVAFVLLFFGYGLDGYGPGLYAKGAFVNLMLALSFFPLQIVVSQWWLRRFRFGPAEWLWRSLTYGKRQPMRRSQLLVGSSAV